MISFLLDNSGTGDSVSSVLSLQAALRAAEPAALLAPPWLLQNIIALDRGLGRSPLTVPHRKSHQIARDRLLDLAREENLDLPDPLPSAATIILLAQPDTDWLDERAPADVLRHYWRLLFHARIDAELEHKLAALGSNAIEARVERIGRSAFNEAKFVLHRERYLSAAADNREAYGEFAAVYLEFQNFRPDLLPVYFPAISDGPAVLSALADDIDAPALLAQTRLAGAADAIFPTPTSDSRAAAHEADAALRSRIDHDGEHVADLLTRAEKAAALGNHVGAAILQRRVFLAKPGNKVAEFDSMQDLNLLVDRLSVALDLSESATLEWRTALAPLLRDAAEGWWNAEGRLLYDLQKICINHEREIYSVGVVEWLLEFCRRPLRRRQPMQRIVLICKSLRSALGRLPRARIITAERATLTQLLRHALHHTELRLRAAAGPAVAESIAAGGLRPRNAVEQVAQRKLIEDLLDYLAHHGFLTLGALRDAIAINQIKFPDLVGDVSPPAPAGPAAATDSTLNHANADGRKNYNLTHDPLFRIDRRLSDTLDGVYHRGEIYLRFFQKVSSLLFATIIGRIITKTVLMPLGGSFIILAGLDHTLFLLIRKITGWHWLEQMPFEHVKGRTAGEILSENLPFFLLALVLLGAINWPAFRTITLRVLWGFFRSIGFVLYDAPRWLLTRPLLQAALKSHAMKLAMRYVGKPLIIAAIACLFVPRHAGGPMRFAVLATAFAAVNFLLNSSAGRAVEHAIGHGLKAIGAKLTLEFFSNAFTAIMRFFQILVEYFERMLYAVDEWLRFREGQPSSSLFIKASLGVIWFYIAYASRFAVNLLIEPQINPIKHFPVVTVSHKIVFPTIGLFTSAFEKLGLSAVRAGTLAAATVTTIPGIFGFLAWELRSNWQLYRANGSKTLKAVPIGSHGESMRRLLRPGFHSGTVPKIFARLRRAQRKSDPQMLLNAQNQQAIHQHQSAVHDIAAAHAALEHVSEAVAHFIQRQMLALLNQHADWRATPVALAKVTLCPTRITIDLACPALDATTARIFFEQRCGWILAGIEHPGWICHTSPAQAGALAAALLGTYKIAAVDVIQEQAQVAFGPQPVAFDFSHEDLFVWRGANFASLSIYKLAANEKTPPEQRLAGRNILLSRTVVEREDWIGVWESPAMNAKPALLPIRVLPESPSACMNS